MSVEKPSNNPNPPFPTPDPAHLQSKVSRDLVHETLVKEQDQETNVIDNIENRDGDNDRMETNSQPTAYGLSSPPPAD